MTGPSGSKKVDVEHASSNEDAPPNYQHSSKVVPGDGSLQATRTRGLQPPDIIAHLSPEERLVLETHLRRKIDFRLLPMIIIMYIMNYIDR
jgi:hypothetical protein